MNRTQQLDLVIKQATSIEIQEGKTWYYKARDYCVELSEEFGIELEKVVGIVAALSVQKRWDLNKRISRQYLQGKRNIHTKTQVSKCDWIMRGDNIEKCLGGLKTVNFYHNILNPEDSNYCTIDLWMLRIFNERPKVTPKQYNQLKQVCIDYSNQIKWVTPTTQAVAWIVARQKAD